VKLSAEFLILFVATIAVAGFVASQVVPMIAQQTQTTNALVSGVALYSDSKLIFVNVRNTGSVDITSVAVTIYQKGTNTPLNSVPFSSWSGATFPIPPGSEEGLQGTLSNVNLVAGQQYLVVVQVTFAGGIVKSYPVMVVCLSG
jgi:hypothetical protein